MPSCWASTATVAGSDRSFQKNYVQLLSNKDLKRDSHDKRYMCAAPKIRPERGRSIAGLCRFIWKKQRANQGVPYSFRLNREVEFDQVSGELRLPEGSLGLNCASFTLIVLLRNGVDLIDIDGWDLREEDIRAQTRILV